MAQWVRVFTALAKDMSSAPSTHIWQFTTLAPPEDPVPFVGTLHLLHACTKKNEFKDVWLRETEKHGNRHLEAKREKRHFVLKTGKINTFKWLWKRSNGGWRLFPKGQEEIIQSILTGWADKAVTSSSIRWRTKRGHSLIEWIFRNYLLQAYMQSEFHLITEN